MMAATSTVQPRDPAAGGMRTYGPVVGDTGKWQALLRGALIIRDRLLQEEQTERASGTGDAWVDQLSAGTSVRALPCTVVGAVAVD